VSSLILLPFICNLILTLGLKEGAKRKDLKTFKLHSKVHALQRQGTVTLTRNGLACLCGTAFVEERGERQRMSSFLSKRLHHFLLACNKHLLDATWFCNDLYTEQPCCKMIRHDFGPNLNCAHQKELRHLCTYGASVHFWVRLRWVSTGCL